MTRRVPGARASLVGLTSERCVTDVSTRSGVRRCRAEGRGAAAPQIITVQLTESMIPYGVSRRVAVWFCSLLGGWDDGIGMSAFERL